MYIAFSFQDHCFLFVGFRLFFALSLSQQSVKASEHACQIILDKAGITGWRLGRSRVFLRYFHEEKLQLLLKEMEDKAVLIQKVYRGYHTRKWSVLYYLAAMQHNYVSTAI